MYATFNVQGSCNNLCDTAHDPNEEAGRTAADIAWLQQTFAEATGSSPCWPRRSTWASRSHTSTATRTTSASTSRCRTRAAAAWRTSRAWRRSATTKETSTGSRRSSIPQSRDVFAFEPVLVPVNQSLERPLRALRLQSGVPGVCPSGQRERAVNPSAQPTEVRILPPPLKRGRQPFSRRLRLFGLVTVVSFGDIPGEIAHLKGANIRVRVMRPLGSTRGPRRGAGSRPARVRSRRMLVAETIKPSLASSPQIWR
jgi:hypothetical protein